MNGLDRIYAAIWSVAKVALVAAAVAAVAWVVITTDPGPEFKTELIEGCEYIHYSRQSSLTHKGNCTNQIHLR